MVLHDHLDVMPGIRPLRTRLRGCTRGVWWVCVGGIGITLVVPSRHDGERSRINGTKLVFWNRTGNDGTDMFRLD